MGVIYFGGLSSENYNIVVTLTPDYVAAERDYEVIKVPGRNGDLILDKGSYSNVERKYSINFATEVTHESFVETAKGISEWLTATPGYSRLEDTYEPDYYRLAMYENNITIENLINMAGQATIIFTCKPQRFLKLGELATSFTAAGNITNPTVHPSLPSIKVYGDGPGVVRIGDYTFQLTEIDGNTIVDCDMQDAYKVSDGLINKNSTLILNDGEFPKLKPGINVVSFTGDITKVEVTPRWWTL